MTKTELIRNLEAISGDPPVFVDIDAAYQWDGGEGTWIEDVEQADIVDVYDLETHVVLQTRKRTEE